jgi:hypothetical protein
VKLKWFRFPALIAHIAAKNTFALSSDLPVRALRENDFTPASVVSENEIAGAKEGFMPMGSRFESSFGDFIALAVGFLAGIVALATSSSIVFYVALQGIASYAERQSPGSFESPLSAAGPLLAAAIATVVFHIVVLGVLALLHVPFAKFFLIAVSLGSASLTATWFWHFIPRSTSTAGIRWGFALWPNTQC